MEVLQFYWISHISLTGKCYILNKLYSVTFTKQKQKARFCQMTPLISSVLYRSFDIWYMNQVNQWDVGITVIQPHNLITVIMFFALCEECLWKQTIFGMFINTDDIWLYFLVTIDSHRCRNGMMPWKTAKCVKWTWKINRERIPAS